MAYPAGSTMDQDGLARSDRCAVYETFPGRNECQRKRRGFAHGEIGRLQREQLGIDRDIGRKRALQTRDRRRSCRRPHRQSGMR